jgi:hypothetical protein
MHGMLEARADHMIDLLKEEIASDEGIRSLSVICAQGDSYYLSLRQFFRVPEPRTTRMGGYMRDFSITDIRSLMKGSRSEDAFICEPNIADLINQQFISMSHSHRVEIIDTPQGSRECSVYLARLPQ